MSSKSSGMSASIAYVLLTLTMFCWAANSVVGRAMRADIPPIALAWWRWLGAALILLPFTVNYLRRDMPLIRQNLPLLCLLSIFGVSTFNTLLYLALQTTSAINTSLMQATVPAIIPVFSWVLYRQSVNLKQVWGILLCIAGAVLVLTNGSLQTLLTLSFTRGDVLMLVAVIVYSLYSVLIRRRPPIHPLSFLAVTFVLGWLFLTPVYLWQPQPFEWTTTVITAILFVAIVPSIIAFFGWNAGVERIGPNPAGLFMPLISVFAALLSIVFLNDSLQWFHFGGIALIFAGMLIFNRA